MRWLVTGSQGFVGRYLCAEILNASPAANVLGLGRSRPLSGCFSHLVTLGGQRVPAPLPESLCVLSSDRYSYQRADIACESDVRSILAEFRPDIIVHLASGLRDDARAHLLRTNMEGTAVLLEAVAACGTPSPKLVLASTGGVYGQPSPGRLPFRESEPCIPVDEYSISKLAAELIARSIASHNSIPLVIARIFNIIGAGQDERHVAGSVAAQLSGPGPAPARSLKLGPLDTTRDFLDVRDVARALWMLAACAGSAEIVNVASGVERSTREVVEGLIEQSGLSVNVEENRAAPPGVPRHFADVSRLRAFGFEPLHSFRESLRSVYLYYRHHSSGLLHAT